MTDNDIGKAAELVLSHQQKFFKWAVGALVGYVTSEIAEMYYEKALVAYRRRKST